MILFGGEAVHVAGYYDIRSENPESISVDWKVSAVRKNEIVH